MTLKPSQIVMLASGLAVLIFSFMAFVDFDLSEAESSQLDQQCKALDDATPQQLQAAGDEQVEAARFACDTLGEGTISAWNTSLLLPAATWPALLAAVVTAMVAANAFGSFKIPDGVLGFSSGQLLVALAFPGALVMFGWLIGGVDDTEWGIGFWFMLVGSVALLVGTVMDLRSGPANQAFRGGFGQPGPGLPQPGYPQPQYPQQGPPQGNGGWGGGQPQPPQQPGPGSGPTPF